MSDLKKQPTYSQFACIGAGLSGIGLGVLLKRKYGITDIKIFERNDGLGGTWLTNTYPGCACDVPSVLFSYSFSPNPQWGSSREQLHAYIEGIVKQYDLDRRIRRRTLVRRCEWLESKTRWLLTVTDLATDTEFQHESQFLYTGTGILVEPRNPDIPGIDSFSGKLFHAAKWDTSATLKDKDVVVVGNGCSADQIVPAIAKQVKSVTQFARSKHWIMPYPPMGSEAVFNALCTYVPGFVDFLRFNVFLLLEYEWKSFGGDKKAAAFRKQREAASAAYMRKKAPEKYHDMLIPDFPIGCKRRIYDPGYLDSLHSDKVDLTNDPILEIVPEGVRTKNGVTKADVIVFATGYATNTYLAGIEIVGRGGKTIEKHWEASGGAEAYNSVLVNGFPNFFMLLGPNTTTGHTSTIMAIENAVNFSLRIIKPVVQGRSLSVEVTKAAEKRDTDEVQQGLTKTVWHGGSCNSWYVRGEDGKIGRNTMTYPFSQSWFQYRCTFPYWKDFTYKANPNPPRPNRLLQLIRLVFWATTFVYGVKALRILRENDWNFQALGLTVALNLQQMYAQVRRRLK